MTTASVGFHCPECIASSQVRVATKTVLGGKFSGDAVVSVSLIGICVVLFVVTGVLHATGGISRWGMQPASIAINGQWFRLFSAIFMHAGWLHLAFNMYVLYLLGPTLERILGHARFLALFILCGLGGSVASYWFSPVMTLSVGASGAIFGLMTAMIVIGIRLKFDVGQIAALFLINVALGFVMGGIDWRAHLGGAAVGALMGLIFSLHAPAGGKANVINQALATAGVLGSLAVAVLWRTMEIQGLAGLG